MKKVFKYSCLGLLLFLLNSCEKFVDVSLPKTQLTGDAVFSSEATANATLLAVYAKLRDAVLLTGERGGISNLLANYADEITDYNASLGHTERDYFQNGVLATASMIRNNWNDSYNLIYTMNVLLEAVDRSSEFLPKERPAFREKLILSELISTFIW